MGGIWKGSLQGRQVFRCEGEYWTIEYLGLTCRLRDSKGMRQLAYLLQHPGMKIPATLLLEVGDIDEASAANARGHPQPFLLASASPVLAERARVTVTRTIKLALGRIATHHPELAQHFEATVRRGHLCSYHPDPHAAVEWE